MDKQHEEIEVGYKEINMVEQKAIDYFKRKIETENQICDLPTCDDEVKTIKQEHITYMQSAIAALEKQILKEIKREINDGRFERHCPNGCQVTGATMYADIKYCPNCGQALKWE